MNDELAGPLAELPADQRGRLRPAPHPRWMEPTLATLTHDHFSDSAWIYERKLDGQRFLGFRHGNEVRLLSRARQRLESTYPEIVEALEAQDNRDFVVDGEVVAFEDGVTSFGRLQQRLGITDARAARRSPVAVVAYVFDLLHLDGHDLRELPLRSRKSLLRQVLSFGGPLRFTPHRNGAGEELHRRACARGWEGVIAKRAAGRYPSKRTRDWRKFKCTASQELVVGGFTEPHGGRAGLGALLVGYHDGGKLVYAGKVGTGYDETTLHDLRARLDAMAVDEPPFAAGDVDAGDGEVHWVRPELVAEIGFTEWTRDGKLRHPRFLGLRHDKPPEQVVREGDRGDTGGSAGR